MTNLCKPWSIVLVPRRPLTPFAAFAWYVMSELLPLGGMVREKCYFRWINETHPRGKVYSPHGGVLNLNAERGLFEHELLKWLKCNLVLVNVPSDSNSKSLPVRDFVFQGNRWQGKPQKNWSKWERWFQELSQISNPQTALELSSGFLRNLVEKKVDPRTTEVDFPYLPPVSPQIDLPKVGSKLCITFPVLKERTNREKHRQSIAYTEKEIPRAPIFQLCGQHTLLAFGGESGAGKSSVVPSLLVAMRDIIKEHQSLGGAWAGLDLKVDMFPLDEATRVSDSVLSSSAQNRKKLRGIKQDWSFDLAETVVRGCEKKLQSANILLADLPGRITDITELLSAHVSFGGIITKDWDGEGRKWQKYFEVIKAPLVFRAKSSRAQSLVTTYDPSELIMGRIFILNRTVRAWDPFIYLAAKLLLFDILPARLGRPQNKPIDLHHREDDCVTVSLK